MTKSEPSKWSKIINQAKVQNIFCEDISRQHLFIKHNCLAYIKTLPGSFLKLGCFVFDEFVSDPRQGYDQNEKRNHVYLFLF